VCVASRNFHDVHVRTQLTLFRGCSSYPDPSRRRCFFFFRMTAPFIPIHQQAAARCSRRLLPAPTSSGRQAPSFTVLQGVAISSTLSLYSARDRFCRPFLFNNLHTLFHSSQKSESPFPFFSSSCALFAKTPRGYPPCSPQNRNYSSYLPFLYFDTSLLLYFIFVRNSLP
jgi:hypothetical protein